MFLCRHPVAWIINSVPSCVGHTLQWCHNEHDVVSNDGRLDRLLNCLFRHRSKKSFLWSVPEQTVESRLKGTVTRKMLCIHSAYVVGSFWTHLQTIESRHWADFRNTNFKRGRQISAEQVTNKSSIQNFPGQRVKYNEVNLNARSFFETNVACSNPH